MNSSAYRPPAAQAQPPLQSQSNNHNDWYSNEADYGYDDGDPDGDQGGDGDADGTEGRDPKRRRIARACDMCRKKKIKCDGKMPKCSHCENYKTECNFTHVEKKRAPPKGAKYIESLENRLGRMESLLRLSGLLAEEDGGATDLGTLERRLAERQTGGNTSSATPQSLPSPPVPQGSKAASVVDVATASPAPPNGVNGGKVTSPSRTAPPAKGPGGDAVQKSGKEVDALADQMCSLITNNVGETRYIGSSSGFSIFSPKGIQWVNEKTGDSSFQHMIASAAHTKDGWDHWKPEVFNDLFQRRIFKPLPARADCYALLKDFFMNFNCMFPLFHEPTFMHLVDKHYSLEPYEGSGWWASLNVALAIAHRLRVMSNVVSQDEDDAAWGYLKNAMAVISELTMRNTDLLSVQALLGMALFLQGTPNPQPSFSLVAAAIRLAHSIGLHKRGSDFNLSDIENEQRKRVFWIAYLLDKDICLRSGRPPAQDDDDMNVELPSENPHDNVGSIPLAQEVDGQKSMNLFRLMCQFAQIQSRVYKQLYSVKASRQSDGELLNTIGELDAQLEEWKDSIPLDFRPEHEIKAAHTPLILHVVVLHFAYYNCLTTIHRMSVHHGYWTSRLSDFAIQGLNARPLNPRVFMSAALCVNAARTSIGLIRYIPQGDYACVWLILYYPVSALVTLFANILQNPQDTRARSDLKLMSSVVAFLVMLERDVSEANGSVRSMLAVCAEFERITRVVLDKAENEMRGRGRRKQADRERERAMKDHSVNGEIAAGLEHGKTLEDIQIETQINYRRPVQTPSMRASIATNSIAGGSPLSWPGSPNGVSTSVNGHGPNPRAPPNPDSSPNNNNNNPISSYTYNPYTATAQQSALAANPTSSYLNPPASASPPFTRASPSTNNLAPPPPAFPQQHHHPSLHTPNPFSPSALNDTDFSTQSLPPEFALNLGDPTHAHHNGFPHPAADLSPIIPGMGTGLGPIGGAFQQPFVPQDLWQMPMTLEWDWAEGLGHSHFTPGPTFESTGTYPDMVNPGMGLRQQQRGGVAGGDGGGAEGGA